MAAARAVNHSDDDPDGDLVGPDTVAPLPVSRCRTRLCIEASAQRGKDRIFVGEHCRATMGRLHHWTTEHDEQAGEAATAELFDELATLDGRRSDLRRVGRRFLLADSKLPVSYALRCLCYRLLQIGTAGPF